MDLTPLYPRLSVVVPVRATSAELRPVLDALLPQARRTGTEVIVVGRELGPLPDDVIAVSVETDDIYVMRALGVSLAHGDVVAHGEDHAIPPSDWCDNVIRAHDERPHADAIAGSVVNGTDDTLCGRTNFLAFAAHFQHPVATLPRRSPPISAVSYKRDALAGVAQRIGWMETGLFAQLAESDAIAVDDRIVITHYQDHGLPRTLVNTFHSARASYGYSLADADLRHRATVARWSVRHWPIRILRDARAARANPPMTPTELATVTALALAATAGAVVGALLGRGRSPLRVA